MTVLPRRPLLAAALAAACALTAGCGSSTHGSTTTGAMSATGASTPTSTASAPVAGAPTAATLAAAEAPRAGAFPAARGRTLQALAGLVKTSAQLGPATGTYTPGSDRIAFAVSTSGGSLIYAPTVVYVARSPGQPAVGPFPAPADPMQVAPPFRSRQYGGPGDIAAIYAAQIPLPHPGVYYVLAMTRTAKGLLGAPGQVAVAPSSPIPAVGQRPPAIATLTPSDVHGDIGLLTTRVPPDDMHSVSFRSVLGREPVALLFSTPALCQSRVCGPVTDVIVSLEQRFRGRITFIHQEIYVANQPSRGLRPQMRAFHLETEPWLFTVNRHGIIAARLEGAFGLNAASQAIEAALR